MDITNGNGILARRIVEEAYQQHTITDIINDFFTKYISAEGISLGKISTIDTTLEVAVYSMRLTDALDELAARSGASWYVGSDKKFYFVIKNDFEVVDVPRESISNWQKETDAKNIRTRQIITGGRQPTSTQVETYEIIADQQFIKLGYPMYEMSGIKINGTPAGVGVYGFDNEDTSKTFLYTYNSDTVNFNTSAIVQPAIGDEVEVTYKGFYNVKSVTKDDVQVEALAARTGTSGIIDNLIVDKTIETINDAAALSRDLLLQNKYGENIVTLNCHDMAATQLLCVWDLDFMSAYLIEGEYVVVERSIEYFTEEKYVISIKLKDRNYIQQYGTIYNKYNKDLQKLSYRPDEVIIQISSFDELITITDSVDFETLGMVFFTCADGEYLDRLEYTMSPWYPSI